MPALHRCAAIVAVAALAACTGDGSSEPSTTGTDPTTSPVPGRVDDGILKIGVLLPRTGPGAAIGAPLIAVIEAAVTTLNDDGGILGRPVRLEIRDEGTDSSSATQAITALTLDEGVDVVIGPGSSRVAASVAPALVESGVLTCSPLATTLLLDELPDNGRFIRTVPSDTLQAQAIARNVDGTGFRSVSVTFPDDLYGRSMGGAVTAALGERGLSVLGEHPYPATGEGFEAAATAILADDPAVVALIGNADNGVRLFSTIDTLASPDTPTVVANDALRSADVTSISGLDVMALTRLSGVSLEPYGGADQVRTLLGLAEDAPTPAFAAAAIDCVNLAALTAHQARSDSPIAMAALAQATTRGGTSCATVDECITLLDLGLDIDYDGPTGLLSLDADGEVVQAEYMDYTFSADGRDTTTERFLIVGG